MTTVKDLVVKLNAQLAAKSSAARAIDATYKFDLKGDGGGQWVASLRDPIGITESTGAADCTLTLAANDFVALFEGRVNGQQLFFSGKLQIDGDMSLALKLQNVAELLR
jgi:predicted lipid carrier protein YhbT